MSDANQLDSKITQYEFEVAIDAPPEKVWKALTAETNAWWLPDFRMVSPQSVVTLAPLAGGHLIEQCDEAGSLLWYTVQFCQPRQHTIYLFGHVAPDWGGPATSHLKWSIVSGENDGCALKVTDGLTGRVSDSTAESLQSGWLNLFTDGLKAYVEKS